MSKYKLSGMADGINTGAFPEPSRKRPPVTDEHLLMLANVFGGEGNDVEPEHFHMVMRLIAEVREHRARGVQIAASTTKVRASTKAKLAEIEREQDRSMARLGRKRAT